MDSKEWSLLPFELCEEILCRLTCKRWLALFIDKRFINKHVKIINPMSGACSSLSLPDEFQAKPQILAMIHCDRFIINPESTDHLINCFFGIGYNILSRDGYKIVILSSKHRYHYSIYKLNSNSWKSFKVSLDWHEVWRCRVVSLKGYMYWIAKYWNTKLKVWVTNKVIKNGVDISWTKVFDNNRIVLGCEEVLADEKNVSGNIYLIGEGEITKQEIKRHGLGFSWPFIFGYGYFPSLVRALTLETE
ncbi:hypothetical protein EUTSA_v10022136mg [Eutrema salsugineum]|uniref:F-box associated beta-propeller type 1 domain-containing protein n=1 Tax=Eutrema salsugineum TaxID=72664 RepID=V4LBB7_EUTSA|nr:hypothetical protein EUTSA_v10022136mg [Eutrema salsugineum]